MLRRLYFLHWVKNVICHSHSVTTGGVCQYLTGDSCIFSPCLTFSLIVWEEGKVLTAETSSCDSNNDLSTSDKQSKVCREEIVSAHQLCICELSSAPLARSWCPDTLTDTMLELLIRAKDSGSGQSHGQFASIKICGMVSMFNAFWSFLSC